MKLIERRRQEASSGLRPINPPKQEKLGNGGSGVRRFSKRIKRGDGFGQRLNWRWFNFSEIPAHGLRLFVRAGAVNGNPAEVLRNLHQSLVVVIPLG